MPRLVRKTPLSERIKAYLDPYDFLLWLAEILNDDSLGEWLKDWATFIGIGLNIVFILARGASNPAGRSGGDDVFGDIDGGSGSGWFAWAVSVWKSCATTQAKTDTQVAGCLPGSSFDIVLLLECLRNLLSQETLPSFRATRG